MANPKRNPERDQVMCRLYQDGKTLEEVGAVFGVTRERVRQILKRAGLSSTDGGAAARGRRRRRAALEARAIERDARAQEQFGCYYDEVVALNDGLKPWNKAALSMRYMQQKRNAAARDIEWSLSFPEWVSIWRDSGHLDERGRGEGYCMARRHDIGPYDLLNVYITTIGQNAADYQAELKARGVDCADGFKRLPERAVLIDHE